MPRKPPRLSTFGRDPRTGERVLRCRGCQENIDPMRPFDHKCINPCAVCGHRHEPGKRCPELVVRPTTHSATNTEACGCTGPSAS